MTSQPREPEPKEARAADQDGDGWLGFLLACARYHELQEAPRTPIDELRIFDNSTHLVDEHIRVSAQSARGWPQSYEQYLDLRMAAFAVQAAGGTIDIASLLVEGGEDDPTASEGASEAVENLRALLHRQEPVESKVLLRRLEQLPREAVVAEWYRPGAQFDSWAEAVLGVARVKERDQWSAARGRSRSTLLRVSTELASTNGAGGGDLLNAFVVELAKACQCEVCDFASVEGGLLRPTAISDPASELRELLEKPYRRAEGIAGSALLLPATSRRRWVGTNDLASDPR